MIPFRGRLTPLTSMLRIAGSGGSPGERMRAVMFVAAAMSVVLVAGLGVAGDPDSVQARQYSAYSDREKPVISFLLSNPENVEDFQREFSLTDGEMEEVLAAVRHENGVLAGTFAKSEKLVRVNRGLPRDQVKQKIAASSYDESVRSAVAQTKVEVKHILPPGSQPDLRRWVDAQWQQERNTFDAQSSTYLTTSSVDTGMTFRVFATQYIGNTRREVAMPHRKLKFDGGYSVRIRPSGSSTKVWARVKEVGPWNTYDNWYALRKYRTMWKDLPRGLPEAQAAFQDNYNRGKDEYGREVLNPAGIDITPVVASEAGLAKNENAWVYVYVPWATRV
ncbi:MAG: hypothetical protein H0V83_04990 [Rubrobacter sp.]|nr:hypothetical protein [Rubrobacter sp.]